MIRLIIALIYVVVFLILTTPLMLISYLMRKGNKAAADRLANSVVMWGFRCVSFICGVKLTVEGKEKVPEGAVMYVANHRSIFDIVIGYPLCKCPTGVIAKRSMNMVPLFRIWMRILYCQFLDRKNPRSGLDVILKAIELEKEGTSILIFPEGTRNRDYSSNKLLEMHAGSFKIALKSGVPIQPFVLVGTENILIRHIPFVRSTKVRVRFLDPIDTKALDKETVKNIGRYVGDIIEKAYSEVKAEMKA